MLTKSGALGCCLGDSEMLTNTLQACSTRQQYDNTHTTHTLSRAQHPHHTHTIEGATPTPHTHYRGCDTHTTHTLSREQHPHHTHTIEGATPTPRSLPHTHTIEGVLKCFMSSKHLCHHGMELAVCGEHSTHEVHHTRLHPKLT